MKTILKLLVILGALAIFFSFQSEKPAVTEVQKPQTENRVVTAPQSASGTKGVVKVGETSQKVYVMGKKFFVFPDYDGVEYDLIDIHGKELSWKEAPCDWKDLMIEYVRFKPTKHDIEYIVRDWN